MKDSPVNYYAVLGLDRDCTADQIREAYRILAKRHHPDLNGSAPGAHERTRELNLAYETLGEAGRREQYDAFLTETGRRERTRQSAPGRSAVKQDVHLRVDELFRGVTLEVAVNDPGNSEGRESYTLVVPPDTAPGTRFRIARDQSAVGGGVLVRIRVRPDTRFRIRGTDLRCDLRIYARRAAEGGVESVRGPRGNSLRVTIPRGVARGAVIRVAGEGLPKARGGRGDLLVRIVYQPEVRIRRKPG